jgi:hypothetical protein
MTKVFGYSAWNKPKEDEEGARTVNQHGLSRKVGSFYSNIISLSV